jgi:glycine cleavage system transcriptional repressor
MPQLIVISAIGNDRAGVVQDLTKVILSCGGNIEESRMTTLGSEFAMLLLVSGNWHTLSRLEKDLDKLCEDGHLQVSIKKTGAKPVEEDRMPYAVDVVALDQQGIVFNLANFFTTRERICSLCRWLSTYPPPCTLHSCGRNSSSSATD